MKFTWKKLIIMGAVQAALLIGFGLAYIIHLLPFGVFMFLIVVTGGATGVIAGHVAK